MADPSVFFEGQEEEPAGETVPVAVALDYDPLAGDNAPRVVASGRGFIAEQILQLAFAHGVRVRKDADLVEVLSAVDIDSEIPLEAFMAVAEILAYVYHANATWPFGDPRAPRSAPPGGERG
ncbi:EscU/YscU/HrcU family type III secretion system export apparatus switch protein [Phaeovibrio sulfidiphilus]|uniref:EscU/YscU/HrcU family type III secretion system export apparatus switch protein n=1 Tax=Phaeovibrio sulfidiphilus TaxID=1220600 RepID=A0A8J7CCA2_9PROT|nr:EscU/YscU/HrcU family type III secretion system export apparatus switch protein [Phaeovibrio sulfidiphilus]